MICHNILDNEIDNLSEVKVSFDYSKVPCASVKRYKIATEDLKTHVKE